jgi:hypothetical protein
MDDDWSPGGGHGWIYGLAAVLILGGAGAGIWYKWDDIKGMLNGPQPVAVDAAPAVADIDAGVAPSPQEGDELIRKLGPETSKAPQIAGWLANADIVQRLAAAVRLIADGQSPRAVLSFVELEGDYFVDSVGQKKLGKHVAGRKKAPNEYVERVFVSPRSYARYDKLTDVFATMDIAYAGRSYRRMRPYFEGAFSQVARPGEHFDDVLAQAIDRLVAVRVPDGQIELVPKGANYLYKDPALESMSAAEKHVLRMGPKNAKIFQDTLRRFAGQAGLTLKH